VCVAQSREEGCGEEDGAQAAFQDGHIGGHTGLIMPHVPGYPAQIRNAEDLPQQ
jgi:hypothetical protein